MDKERVLPPPEYTKQCNMHWLEMIGSGGESFGLVALQWNPGSQTWTHSQAHSSTALPIETNGWKYIEVIPYPSMEKMNG